MEVAHGRGTVAALEAHPYDLAARHQVLVPLHDRAGELLHHEPAAGVAQVKRGAS